MFFIVNAKKGTGFCLQILELLFGSNALNNLALS